ncbi:hypothetical protein IC582_011278 [Cucumis melo]
MITTSTMLSNDVAQYLSSPLIGGTSQSIIVFSINFASSVLGFIENLARMSNSLFEEKGYLFAATRTKKGEFFDEIFRKYKLYVEPIDNILSKKKMLETLLFCE